MRTTSGMKISGVFLLDDNATADDAGIASPAPSSTPRDAPSAARSRGASGKRNDGTDSNYMDHEKNNGGHLYASQIILLSLIGVTGVCVLLGWLLRRRR